jgi:hypothetical protein
MSGYRRAAVALHGVAAEDQSWVLDALAPAEKATLMQLLDELKELGFSEDASNVADIFDLSRDARHAVPASLTDRVRHASAEQLFAILENEPSSLIAHFLSIAQWPWSEAFLNLFPAIRKERILASISHSLSIAPARTAYLLNSVAGRLSNSIDSSEKAVPANHKGGLSGLIHAALSPVRRMATAWNR